MEVVDFIQAGLERVKMGTARVLDGLKPSELAWRPGPEANSIGLILFHQLRSEDVFVQSRIQGKPQVWETEKWFQKLNIPVADTGSGFSAEQCAAFIVPELKDLLAYGDSVRARTKEYLKGMTPESFDRIINMPRLGDVAIGEVFALIVVHMSQHVGEMAYLRGLQRGMNK